eukprot:CAMPEP_0198699338 /NCGR_PEP_ID=MMETSP1468-20131203/352075_1 /TAXON_ID=1461545 /ORGANISM="Mantoniella sp, Strain CCMP1436" /LENGTH=72 /DNA_ID=CAMNT_0044456789 /DNA_START=214 /DNA_END=429 /DNA_ORIENTATION=+
MEALPKYRAPACDAPNQRYAAPNAIYLCASVWDVTPLHAHAQPVAVLWGAPRRGTTFTTPHAVLATLTLPCL